MIFCDYKKNPLCIHWLTDDFCSAVQCMEGTLNCQKSDNLLIDKCEKSRQAEQHLCHTGLCDIAIPVIKRDIIVGYVVTGRIRTPDTSAHPPKKFVSIEHLCRETTFFSYKKLDCLKSLLPRIIFSNAIEIEFHNQLDEITEYIDLHLNQKLNISSLCKQFHISKDSLYEAFRTELHCTVNEYISQQRLKKAKELLADTDFPIYRITEMIGFDDSAYFCRFFKQRTGSSPSTFRAQHM
jgi:AraC-like DNA-binding protein